MDTDINSHADETTMESYASISLDDLSRFLLVSNVLFPRMREPVSHSFQTIYPPSCEGSKHLPRFEESKHPPQCLQMLFKVQYIITRLQKIYISCRHLGLNPRRTFCAIIFQLLSNLIIYVLLIPNLAYAEQKYAIIHSCFLPV